MIRKFININSKICSAIEKHLPQAKFRIFEFYIKTIGEKIELLKNNSSVLDVGAGKNCLFAKYKNKNFKLIGIDISDDELMHNIELDEKIMADITKEIPLPTNSIDLVVSRSVLEHLSDLENFIKQTKNVLKPGGYTIHLLPSKFAIFALINQLLPAKISKAVINSFYPESLGICGFPAYYNRCYYSAIEELYKNNGFEVESIKTSYFQSQYFRFFMPFYLISALYESLVYKLNLKNLAAYLLIIARKKECADLLTYSDFS